MEENLSKLNAAMTILIEIKSMGLFSILKSDRLNICLSVSPCREWWQGHIPKLASRHDPGWEFCSGN